MHTECGKFIKSHNKKLINSSNHHEQPCDCRKKEDCPLEEKCRTENIIYKCIASTSGHSDKVYLGTAEGDFKEDIITTSVLSKMRHKWIKPPRLSIFANKSRDIT